ncbi:hypothetical protein CHRY9393_03086 [Chryseobacterium fistulae]|uniref:Uncharacterized protein n=1 Tax=Chryseobacterium fistulae TaxID=2675058 RepID=A0A6N4XU47_9FLAO|nr:hypothetical protein CHRY9393_03086 [Chryseobacterium fistulae]
MFFINLFNQSNSVLVILPLVKILHTYGESIIRNIKKNNKFNLRNILLFMTNETNEGVFIPQNKLK